VSAVVLNVVALVLVVGISWFGMMWLAGRVHGHADDVDEEWMITELRTGDPCPECDGVGAKPNMGGLAPCELCEGTGEISTLPS
jgi:hypothetical protein